MARSIETRAATVDEAVKVALAELAIDEADATIEVLADPQDGTEAVVRVTARSAGRDDGAEDLEEQADAVADFLEELLAHMDIDAIAEPIARGSHMYVDIVDGPEDDMSLLIGRHGQTLDAIQEITRMVVSRRLDERVRVIVDVEDYRKRREDKLIDRARELSRESIETGREHELEPMNPFERKLVHDAVAEIEGVETSSRGEEPNRFVVIRPVQSR
jgi:spoIIIJ-associated protein